MFGSVLSFLMYLLLIKDATSTQKIALLMPLRHHDYYIHHPNDCLKQTDQRHNLIYLSYVPVKSQVEKSLKALSGGKPQSVGALV